MNRARATKLPRRFALLLTAGLATLHLATCAGEVQVNGRTFTLPEGFTIELIAGPPLVDRPITAAFDEQGRLYVSDSSGTNDPVQKQLAEKPHRILRLEDADGDGKFDRRTVFADRMMFPEGTMWHDGSLYVSAPPSIWKLTDTDNDGVADRREEWFQGKTLTGCANDLHGPYLGPDGWIYWCKGAFAQQTYPRPGKPPFVTRASHIFRCRPDGSGFEPVMTGGMDNPVDVVFTPGGERIFSATFLQRPGGGFRDGLAHAVYGGIHGKVNDVTSDPVHKWTGPDLMPILSQLGPAAPCGLVRLESNTLGTEYQDNLFTCCFNLHKVTRHILEPDGATFKSKDSDFVVGSEVDFHPTDILEDADGSLLIIDTGGWYKLCCPTSVFHKPDVLGGIYRVTRSGAPRPIDPRGLKIDWAKAAPGALSSYLDDRRPVVRERAIAEFARRGSASIATLADLGRSLRRRQARVNAVWALTRIDSPEARAAVRATLGETDPLVRMVALQSVSLHRDRDALPRLIEILKEGSAAQRRLAAEALGRIGDSSAVAPLLAAVGQANDRILEHSLIYALIQIADRERTIVGLSSENPNVRRAALIALDQMDGGGVVPTAVTSELAAAEPERRRAAAWIVSRHPEWGDTLADFLRHRLGTDELAPAERTELEDQLARFAGTRPVQDLLVQTLSNPLASSALRLTVLRAMAQAGLKEAPPEWFDTLAGVLASDDPEVIAQAVTTVHALPLPRERKDDPVLRDRLLRLASDPKQPAAVRLSALVAAPGGPGPLPPDLFAFVLEQLNPDQPVPLRGAAVEVLTRASLTASQHGALADALGHVGPLEADRLLAAFEKVKDDETGLRLVAALKQSPALSSLRPDSLHQRLAAFGPKVQKEAEALYAALNVDLNQQRLKLEQLFQSLSAGDIRRGQAIFYGTKVACSSCHAIGYLGGKVGPDLSKIGQVRTDRDLLESIAFPSATFVRSYEPLLVATKDGQVINGVLKQDALDEIVLALDANREVRIARSDIEEMRPGTVSVMPAGLDQQLSPQELADLVAFLKACK